MGCRQGGGLVGCLWRGPRDRTVNLVAQNGDGGPKKFSDFSYTDSNISPGGCLFFEVLGGEWFSNLFLSPRTTKHGGDGLHMT